MVERHQHHDQSAQEIDAVETHAARGTRQVARARGARNVHTPQINPGHAIVPWVASRCAGSRAEEVCTDARNRRFEMMWRVSGGAASTATTRGRARTDDHPPLRPCFMLSHQGHTPGTRLLLHALTWTGWRWPFSAASMQSWRDSSFFSADIQRRS